MDPDHAFPGQNLLQPGLRSGYLSVVSIVFCVGASCCGARRENENSSIITSIPSKGPSPKTVLSEAGYTTESMVMWLILTRIHDHSGADVGEIMQ